MNKQFYPSIFFIQLFTFLFVPYTAQAGIGVEALPYDSMRNYVGANPQQYMGQQFYVKGLPGNSQALGYSGFVTDYKKDDVILNDRKNVYKVGDGYNTMYEALVGHYFDVVDVIAHPQAKSDPEEYGKYSYLKLKAQPGDDVVYYRYDSKASNLSFPFIVIGFYDKQREMLVNKEFIFAKGALGNPVDVAGNQPVKHNTQGQKWKCFRLTIDPQKYQLALVLQNNYAERIIVPYDVIDPDTGDGRKAYSADEYTAYMKKFGKVSFGHVLENIVKTGMTKEMCRLSWGEPTGVEKDGTVEKWTYPAGVLVFGGDRLTKTE